MSRGLKTAITLAALSVLLVAGVAWGFSAVTQPFPGKAEVPICVDRSVDPGETVYPEQVTVSVLNASKREGLAGRTMALFEEDGFAKGETGNAPKGTTVRRATIWTDDVDSAAVRLVRSRLGKIDVVKKSVAAPGIAVLVGDDFKDLRKGRPSVVAGSAFVMCGPSVS